MLKFPPSPLDVNYGLTVSEVSKRLIPAGTRLVQIYEPTGVVSYWRSEEHFYSGLPGKPAGVRPIFLPARVYNVAGLEGVAIHVLECELEHFEESRRRRQAGANEEFELALPEDLAYILLQLPGSIISNILLLSRPNWNDPYTQQRNLVGQRRREERFAAEKGKPPKRKPVPKLFGYAAQMIDGTVAFFGMWKSHNFRCNAVHEYCHLVHKANASYATPNRYPLEWRLFCHAVAFEWEKWMPKNSNSMLGCWSEHGAGLGQELMHWAGTVAEETILKAPLRSYFWLKMLEKQMLEKPPEIGAAQLWARIRLSQKTVRKLAMRSLTEVADVQPEAQEMITYLNAHEEVELQNLDTGELAA